MTVQVEVLSSITDEIVDAVAKLLPQLSTSAKQLDAAAIDEINSSPATTILLARCDGKIAGMLTLAMFPIPTQVKAWIEDVVVDEEFRGRGAGEELTKEALRLARAAGARRVDLTTRPSRGAAGRLYERVGFQLRDTRVYRYTFE